MSKDRNTFAKRQREVEKKRKATEKRTRRAQKKQRPLEEAREVRPPRVLLSLAEYSVLREFRQCATTDDPTICFDREKLATLRTPLVQLTHKGLLAEASQGCYSLTPDGFKAMNAGK